MINNKIDLNKVKSLYEIGGCYIWQYGKYQSQYKWCKEDNKPYLINENSNEEIKGLRNIKKYCEINNLELEMW